MYTYIHPQSKVQGWAKVLVCRTKSGPHLTPIKALALQTPYALQDPRDKEDRQGQGTPTLGKSLPHQPSDA